MEVWFYFRIETAAERPTRRADDANDFKSLFSVAAFIPSSRRSRLERCPVTALIRTYRDLCHNFRFADKPGVMNASDIRSTAE